MANKKADEKKAADEPVKVQIVEPVDDTPPAEPEPFPESEPIPAVKSPVTNTVVNTNERAKVRELESGEENWMWPVDAAEAVATGRYEIVTDDMPKQLPSEEIPTVVTGATNAIIQPVSPEAESEGAKKSPSKK